MGGVATGALVTGAGAGIITGDGAVGGVDGWIACHVVGPQTLASAMFTKNSRDNITIGGVERHMMMKVMVLMLVVDEKKSAHAKPNCESS